jgi:hypothetical protein
VYWYRGFEISYSEDLAKDLLAVHGLYADREQRECVDLYLDFGITLKYVHPVSEKFPFLMERITKINGNSVGFYLRKAEVGDYGLCL